MQSIKQSLLILLYLNKTLDLHYVDISQGCDREC